MSDRIAEAMARLCAAERDTREAIDDLITLGVVRSLANLDWAAMSDGILPWNPSTGEWWFLQGRRAPSGMPAPRRADA